MGWAQRLSDMSIRFYEAIRSRDAVQAAAGELTGTPASLASSKYVLIVTYRKSGEAVPTPVWFGLDGHRLYFRSVSTGRKLERIASNPRVLVAPCSATGRPTGPSFAATARLLTTAADESRAEAAIRKNYRVGRRLYASLIAPRVPGRFVEVCFDRASRHEPS